MPQIQQTPHRISYEKSSKRVRVRFNGRTIADSHDTLLLHEGRLPPVYYFPRTDVRMELLQRSAHSTHCPFKGDATYWSVTVRDKYAENAVWSYENPIVDVADIKDYLAFYADKMDIRPEDDLA